MNQNPPTDRDFRSKADKNLVPPSGASNEVLEAWDGISAYDSMEQARREAAMLDFRFVAVMRITGASRVRVLKTFGRGHYTLFGHKDDLRAAVIDVVAL